MQMQETAKATLVCEGLAEVPLGTSPSVWRGMGWSCCSSVCAHGQRFLLRPSQKMPRSNPSGGAGSTLAISAASRYFPSFHAGSPLSPQGCELHWRETQSVSCGLAQRMEKREPGHSRALGNRGIVKVGKDI